VRPQLRGGRWVQSLQEQQTSEMGIFVSVYTTVEMCTTRESEIRAKRVGCKTNLAGGGAMSLNRARKVTAKLNELGYLNLTVLYEINVIALRHAEAVLCVSLEQSVFMWYRFIELLISVY